MSIFQSFPLPTAATVHPAFRLPRLAKCVSEAHRAFEVKVLREKLMKLDDASIAQYLQIAYRAGWLSEEALVAMAASATVGSLYTAMLGSLEAQAQRTLLADAIAIPRTIQRLGASAISPKGIHNLAKVAISLDIVTPSEVVSHWSASSDPTTTFPTAFCQSFDTFLYGETEPSQEEGCDKDVERMLDVYLHQHGDNLGVTFEPTLKEWKMRIPMADTADSVMLRDALLLMMDTLSVLGIYFHGPLDCMARNFFMEEDAANLEGALSDTPTMDEVLSNLTLVAREAACDLAPDLADGDLIELLDSEDVLVKIEDHFPCLIGNLLHIQGAETPMRIIRDWASLVAVMSNASHWSQQRRLPDYSMIECEVEKRQHFVNHCRETLGAVTAQLGDSIPQTVAAMSKIGEWMQALVACRLDPADYIEDDDGVYFGESFQIQPLCGDEVPGWLALSYEMAKDSIEEEASQVGIQVLRVPECDEHDTQVLEDCIEIVARYAKFSALVDALCSAQANEKCAIN